jgi:hypothetical protein
MELSPGTDSRVLDAPNDIRMAINSDSIPVAVWCGRELAANESEDTEQIGFAQRLLDKGNPVFPVVDDFAVFSSKVPKALHAINGEIWNNLDAVVANLLSGFGLVRQQRRIFISYKRDESIDVAIQLFKELQLRKYDVFLDSASIEAGCAFQDQLHSKLANVDLVVLLHTKTALDSTWVYEELVAAQERGTEVLEVLWPDEKPYPEMSLGFLFELLDNDLDSNTPCLTQSCVERLLPEIEKSRIRSVRTRRDRIIRQLNQDAKDIGLSMTYCPAGSDTLPLPHVSLWQAASASPVAVLLTADGTPDCQELYSRKRALNDAHHPTDGARLVYDQIGVLAGQVQTLDWLNQHLDMKSVSVQEARRWMNGL